MGRSRAELAPDIGPVFEKIGQRHFSRLELDNYTPATNFGGDVAKLKPLGIPVNAWASKRFVERQRRGVRSNLPTRPPGEYAGP